MSDDDSTYEITLNRDALRNLLIKTIFLIILVLGPILILWASQSALEAYFGVADPSNPSWMAIAGIMLLWYIIMFALLLPRIGRSIDRRYPP